MKQFYQSLQLLSLLCLPQFIQAQFSFVENKGQWDGNFQYKTEIPGGAIFFSGNGLTYNLADFSEVQEAHETGSPLPPNFQVEGHAFSLEFTGIQGGNWVGSNPTRYYNNYILGKDPARWKSQIYPMKQLTWNEIYPGIQLDWKGYLDGLKYEFRVAPGANPMQIHWKYEGATYVEIDEDGSLVVENSIRNLSDSRPFAYQLIGGDTVQVNCEFMKKGEEWGFTLGQYRKDVELVIDPTLIFGSYSGSTTDNWGYCATYDGQGNLYSGSIANGLGFPTTLGAYQNTWNGGHGTVFPSDIVIAKYHETQGTILYATYLGGNGSELPHSIIVNNYDEVFVFGTTGSADYPVTSNAYDQTFNGGQLNTTTSMNINYNNGSDLIVSRLNANGTALMASTYMGGTGNDGINATTPLRFNYADEVRGEIIIDNNNNIYVATTTRSTDFPVSNGAFQPAFSGGTQDGVVFKMDNSLTTLLWSSYYGGTGNDAIYAIDLYPNNDIVVSGGTTSQDLFMTGPNFNTYGGGNADGFVAKINSSGTSILNSIYVGSPNYDQTYMVERDQLDNIYVLGQTSAPGNFWIQNTNFNTPSAGQFIRKYNASLTNIDWSTAFGTGDGTPDISPSAFLVDVCNKIYVSGWGGAVNSGFYAGSTTSGLPVTVGAFQTSTDGSDYYLMVIDDSANTLVYATYYGGGTSAEHVDGGTSRFNRKGEIYQSVCAGCGSNDDFPTTPGSQSQTNNSTNCNNGVFKFSFDFPVTVADFQVPPSGCAPVSMNFTNNSTGANDYYWDFGDGNNSTAVNPTHVYNNAGTYTVMLIAYDSTGTNCNLSDTIRKQVLILTDSTRIFADIEICTGESVGIGIPPNGDPSITYLWSPGGSLSDSLVPNPIATPGSSTVYQLLISNGNCIDTVIQPVQVLNLPVNSDTNLLICIGDTVQIGLTDTTGISFFTWTPQLNLVDPNEALTGAFPTANTTYTLVYGNSSCSDSLTFNFTIVAGQGYVNPPALMCPGDTILLDATVPNNISYQWTPAAGIISPNTAITPASPAVTTNYIVFTNDGNCFDTVYQTVNVLDLASLPDTTYHICIGSSVQFNPNDPSGGQLTWQWVPPAGLDNPNISNPNASPQMTTTYTALFAFNGQPNICNGSDQVTVIVDDQLPVAGIGYGPAAACDGVYMNFTDLSTNASEVIWIINGDTLTPAELAIYLADFNDTLEITQIAINGKCEHSITETFPVGSFDDYFTLQMPNIFTPGVTEGFNDTFCPIGFSGDYCYKMFIYNRWGLLIWQSYYEDPCWDGNVIKTEEPVVEGVYYWVLYVGDNDTTPEQGFVHVFRHEN